MFVFILDHHVLFDIYSASSLTQAYE